VILGCSAATPRRVTITGLLFLLFFYKAQLATERGGVNCRRSGEVVTSIVIYVPDYSHMGSILLQVVGKKRFSTP
jgi:hypothetical protein